MSSRYYRKNMPITIAISKKSTMALPGTLEEHLVTCILPHPTQLNTSWVGLIFLCKPQNHKPHQTRPSLFLSSYTTKLDQIQYATLFQPNKTIHSKKLGQPPAQQKLRKNYPNFQNLIFTQI